MANYKFDGRVLRDHSGNRVATVEGSRFKDAHGSSAGHIDGRFVRDRSGQRIGEIDGTNIKDARGSRIATIDEVRRVIDGSGGATIAALWLLFVH